LLAAACCGLLVLLWSTLRPAPDLGPLNRLLARGDFDRAEALLVDYLRANPSEQKTRFFLAQLAVDRPDPKKPQLALEQTKRLRSDSAHAAASIKVVQGKAYYLLHRFVDAEAAWNEALRLDPIAPEAGWGLMSLYSLQNRAEDTRRMALKLHAIEPNVHDQVQYLLQIIRYDAHALAPGSVIDQMEKVVRTDPSDIASTLALGIAMIHDGRRTEEGIAYLRGAVEHHPQNARAWEVYLTGLGDAGQMREMANAYEQAPSEVRDDPRLAEASGRIALDQRRWADAARFLRVAAERDPFNKEVVYRLCQALDHSGAQQEAASLRPRVTSIEAARVQMRSLYDKADRNKSLGDVPDYELYQALAEDMENLGRYQEARAWHRLVLRDRPEDPISKPAAARLAKVVKGAEP
jgi:tetratricopeptide (TPR) repeat protein